MKQTFLMMLITITAFGAQAQFQQPEADSTWKTIFRASHPKTHDLVHTKLDVKFDYEKAYLYGNEWLTLQPHFYASDSVELDAKGMEFKNISIVQGKTNKPAQYKYDGRKLRIKLDKIYKAGEKYTLYFDYISKPNELESKGSVAILDSKGLYFVNPTGETKDKPTQIWTQGETEANSAWMVTIDKPNQKTTQEIYMTVPAKYVTLSNGIKVSEKKNANGTRTDYWKQDLAHAPYLFFMGVGDFAIIKDKPYKGKEVSYYVTHDQAPYAKAVFGNTPEMIEFFSKKLGVEYPWAKYAQIVGQDYVSGAMENTTATLHQDGAYQNHRELTDGNRWEETIAHELFHHWFGDLVTAESWSNLTVNESFANYSEYIWDEYKYGKDFADNHNYTDMVGYLMSGSQDKDLVRYHYKDKEDMFDAVSYNKGGRILHMLRNYVGDDAFFAALKLYLNTYQFKTGEADQLRLVFEEVTGQDLNWFWNQWYFGKGHPSLNIRYNYDVPGATEVIIEQTQKGQVFILPMAVDVYENGKANRYNIVADSKIDTFYFSSSSRPEWVNVDADKILLAVKKDNKSEADYVAQWKYAKTYLDRREAIDYFAKSTMPEIAKGLHDKFGPLRAYTIQKISATPYKSDKVVLETIENIAKRDTDKKTRAAAIQFLSQTGDMKYNEMYSTAIKDSSYSVAGAALEGLKKLNPEQAYSIAKTYSKDAKGDLAQAITSILIEQGTEADFDFIAKSYDDAAPNQEKIGLTTNFAKYLASVSDIAKVKIGIDYIMNFRNMIPESYRVYVDPAFKAALQNVIKSNGAEIEKYVEDAFK